MSPTRTTGIRRSSPRQRGELYTQKSGLLGVYVNDVYKDGYNNPSGALNLIELVNGDRVEFYYADGIEDPTDFSAVKAAASAAVKTIVGDR